jgi:hypothetical protein
MSDLIAIASPGEARRSALPRAWLTRVAPRREGSSGGDLVAISRAPQKSR